MKRVHFIVLISRSVHSFIQVRTLLIKSDLIEIIDSWNNVVITLKAITYAPYLNY